MHETRRMQVLRGLLMDLAAYGFPPRDLCASPILGGHGTVEFLAHFHQDARLERTENLLARAAEDLEANPPRELPDFNR